MTFESLNDNVMLVELSFEEMKKYHITYETLQGDSANTQIAVKNILSVIKESDNFNTSDKITIEALPIDNGGCFFIFTFSPKKKTRYRVKKNSAFSLFTTDKIDNLLDFVSVLKSTCPKNQKYNIYKMGSSFYMQIPSNSNQINAVASEFGNFSNIEPEKLYEYGESFGSIVV